MSPHTKLSNREVPLDPLERERLLTEHLPDVRYIARRIHDRLPVQVPLEDLVHAGVIGLIDAVDKFDPKRQVMLKTYAKFRIRGAILDSLRAVDWSPRSLRKRGRLVEQTYHDLCLQLGRAPVESELAERMGMDLRQFQLLLGELNSSNIGSLQLQTNESGEEIYADQASAADDDPFTQCLHSELKGVLTEAMNVLEENERRVIALYYFEELTMKEVGAVLDIGESRVSQIHSMTLVRLRVRVRELLQARASSGAEAENSSLHFS